MATADTSVASVDQIRVTHGLCSRRSGRNAAAQRLTVSGACVNETNWLEFAQEFFATDLLKELQRA